MAHHFKYSSFFIVTLISFSSLASYNWRQLEVAVAQNRDVLVGAWAEQKGPYTEEMRCAFARFNLNAKNWDFVYTHQNPNFNLSGNPSISVGSDGVFHAVCMSVNSDYSKGVIEYSRSIDSGKTWSTFQTLVYNEHGIPDKPWIKVNNDGQIAIVYAELNLQVSPVQIHSITMAIVSNDNGETWEKPQSVALPPELKTSLYYNGFQGQWIDTFNQDWIFSLGEYDGGGIYFCRNSKINQLCKDSVLVATSPNEGAPITQLFKNESEQIVGVLWYEAHEFNSVYFSLSFDEGITWSSPILVSQKGSLASGVVEGSNVSILFSEKIENTAIATKIRRFNFNGQLVKETSLSASENPEFDTYYGGYQSLIYSTSLSTHLAFWIDFKNSKQILNFQKIFD